MSNTNFRKIAEYYSRPDVQKAILGVAKDREIVSVFKDGRFGRRPDILQYSGDIMQGVKTGTVSFHGSVERWKQPMKLDTGMTKQQLDKLRSGWDVIIDIDVPDFVIAKVTAQHIIRALREHGVSSVSIKFTGGKSFHIGVPFEALPKKVDMKPIELQYPQAMEKIMEYIKWYTTEPLRDALLEIAPPTELAERVGKSLADIVSDQGIEPFKIVSMDIFGSRHMFRLPYSLHEKSLLVSLPLRPEQLATFKKEDADPSKAKVDEIFLQRDIQREDAHALIIETFDWAAKYMKEREEALPKPREKKKLRKIPETDFPPCVHAIYKGMADGRKRSVFVLINFLRNMGWSAEEIEKRLAEWNEKNYPPLRTNYIRSQLRWHWQQAQHDRNLLPPNCDNENFYCGYNVCKPDGFCIAGTSMQPQTAAQPCTAGITIKNPVNYAFRKMKREGNLKKSKSGKTDKQKRDRRKKFYTRLRKNTGTRSTTTFKR
jgi:hypothetical protein